MNKKISNIRFFRTLYKAISGDITNTFKIIKIYEGLIVDNSIINGSYNQDCRDYIEDKMIEQIKKFKISKYLGK